MIKIVTELNKIHEQISGITGFGGHTSIATLQAALLGHAVSINSFVSSLCNGVRHLVFFIYLFPSS